MGLCLGELDLCIPLGCLCVLSHSRTAQLTVQPRIYRILLLGWSGGAVWS